MRRRHRRQGVREVVRARQSQVAFGLTCGACEPGARAVYAFGAPIRFRSRIDRKDLHRGPATLFDQPGETRIRAVDDQPSAPRGAPQQQVKLPKHRIQVGIDIGVIVLDIVDDHGARAVVQELGVLVEERGVVLVALNNKMPPAPQPGGAFEITGRSPDQVAGIQSRLMQQPGGHAGGRSFAVGAGHRDYLAIAQYMRTQPFGTRHERKT